MIGQDSGLKQLCRALDGALQSVQLVEFIVQMQYGSATEPA